MPNPSHRSRAWLTVLIGVVGVVVGGALLINQIVFTARAEPATAEVIGSTSYLHTGRGGCRGLTYQPRVTFTTRTGQRTVAVLTNSTSCSRPRTGVTMKIVYDRTHPETAQQQGQTSLWVAPSILITLGAIFLAGGLVVSRAGRKRARRR